jgi:hypothetical protein
MLVVFGAAPRHASADVHVERPRTDARLCHVSPELCAPGGWDRMQQNVSQQLAQTADNLGQWCFSKGFLERSLRLRRSFRMRLAEFWHPFSSSKCRRRDLWLGCFANTDGRWLPVPHGMRYVGRRLARADRTRSTR